MWKRRWIDARIPYPTSHPDFYIKRIQAAAGSTGYDPSCAHEEGKRTGHQLLVQQIHQNSPTHYDLDIECRLDTLSACEICPSCINGRDPVANHFQYQRHSESQR